MKYDRILLDMEVQNDFLIPSGTCYTLESDGVARNIRRLFAWAQQENVRVLSTLLRVSGHIPGPLSLQPHCIEGSEGEKKLSGTVVVNRINFGLLNTTDLPDDVFDIYQQVIIEKRHTDIFAHQRIERLITQLESATFIICGVGVGHGIVQAAVGLRSRGFGVIIVEDATLGLNDPNVEMARLRMEAKGAVFCPTDKIVMPAVAVPRGRRLRRHVVPGRRAG